MTLFQQLTASFRIVRTALRRMQREFRQQLRAEAGGYQLHGGNRIQNADIGAFSYVSHNSIIESATVGRYCSIGPNCVIGFGDHPLHLISTSPRIYYNPGCVGDQAARSFKAANYTRVVIKNDVWIGANAVIKNGVVVGNGAVIGAGAVVTQNVPDYAIAVGVPAKVVKFRFQPERVNQLLASEWWLKDPSALSVEFVRKFSDADTV
jgi:acetyltransferase-like isoleucine patch superfamily enzyme